jgi:hypothetical protein
MRSSKKTFTALVTDSRVARAAATTSFQIGIGDLTTQI